MSESVPAGSRVEVDAGLLDDVRRKLAAYDATAGQASGDIVSRAGGIVSRALFLAATRKLLAAAGPVEPEKPGVLVDHDLLSALYYDAQELGEGYAAASTERMELARKNAAAADALLTAAEQRHVYGASRG